MWNHRSTDGYCRARRARYVGVTAVLVAAFAAVAGSGSALAALQPADLRVAISGPATVPIGGSGTFTVTITNPAVWVPVCVFDPVLRRRVCEPEVASADATGVRLDLSLPGFAVSVPSSPGAGFACTGATGSASCLQGAVLADDSVTITFTARAGTAPGSYVATATVDPGNAILERSETNNSAAAAVTIPAPPPPLPNLWAVGSASPSPFPVLQPVTFFLTVANLGTAAASNIDIDIFTNLGAGLDSWTLGGGFSCVGLSNVGQRLQVHCSGGSLGPSTTATLRIEVRLANQFTPSGTPFTMFGYLDPQNTIIEGNEQDNQFQMLAFVQ
jgi:hypothetical protein